MSKHGLILEGLQSIKEFGETFNKAKAKTLLKDVQKKIATSEYKTVKLKGVGNLSRADLETIEMYCEQIIKSGNINGLMSPRGGVEEVLKKYGVM